MHSSSSILAPAIAALVACATAAHGSLTLANGNFESQPATDNATDVTGWYDYDSGNFWEQTWLEGVDTPDDYNFSLALAGDVNAGRCWAYQGIGTADGATTLKVSFDYGSFADATNLRDLGVTWKIYKVTGSFTAGQNVDIDSAPGVTLLDSASVNALQVAPNAKVGMTSVSLDLSNAGGSQLYLRVSNFSPTNNSNSNGYLWVDQVSISTENLPPVPDPLTAVPIEKVVIDDDFWAPKLSQWTQTTANDVFDKFEQYGGFANFDLVASGATTGHRGENWWDGLIYESIRGASDLLRAHPNAALERRIDGFIDRIGAAAAKDPDGYLNTAQELNSADAPVGFKWTNPPAPGDPLNDNNPHTIYNAGCLVEAGIHYYRATGKTKLLEIATRQAGYMTTVMGASPKAPFIPGHALPEEAFLKLYQLYRDQPALKTAVSLTVNEQDFLTLAKFWVETRGHTDGRESAGAYNQDATPVFSQPVMVGHAVRSGLLATGVAAIGSETRDPRYLAAGKRWWQNLFDARTFLTGGMGAIAANEGFGDDYQLPNNGYCETCAAVTGGFFSENMNLATGDGHYIDLLEKELYNGALSGVALDGQHYFYENPLTEDANHRRWSWAGQNLGRTPCCPPMFLKLMGGLPSYIYATKGDAVYVNLYIGSEADISTGALSLKLKQTTAYPWDGAVEIDVNPTQEATFTLNLRIPGWAGTSQITVNGGSSGAVPMANQYAVLTRTWKPGDKVRLTLPMPVERVKADARVAADTGHVALTRGPVVYCFEGLDNRNACKAILLGQGDALQAAYEPDLLGGVVGITGQSAMIRQNGGALRQEPATVKAVPFFANANRDPSAMDVWIADDSSTVQPTISGTPAASYCNPTDSVTALNDGVIPRSSDDGSIPRMTWWDHKGTSEWAQLTYDTPRAISSVGLYWWDESHVGHDCRVPQSWSVQYLDGSGNWQPVQNSSVCGVAMDQFNYVTFSTVQTAGIRIVAQLQSGWSGGIMEMLVGTTWPVPTASHTWTDDTVVALNDGVIPASSDDGGISRQTFWDDKGTSEWAQLDFGSPQHLSKFQIYWWDERRVGGSCRVPAAWSLEYLDGAIWKPVQGVTAYGTDMDTFNTVTFDQVETTAIRVNVQLQDGWSGGILEMRAYQPPLTSSATSWLIDNGFNPATNMELDPSGHGVPLLEAYALGLDPAHDPVGGVPSPQWTGGNLGLSFWGGRGDVTYSGEASSDLKVWTTQGVTLSAPDTAGMRTVLLQQSSGPARFLRLRFETTP